MITINDFEKLINLAKKDTENQQFFDSNEAINFFYFALKNRIERMKRIEDAT